MKTIYHTIIILMISTIATVAGPFGSKAEGVSVVAVDEPRPPFFPGEKLTFVLKWGAIPAGEATLEVQSIESISGKDVFRFVMTARTNTFADLFFVVRDKIEGFSDLAMERSMFYRAKQHEGGYKKNSTIAFDWEKQTAQYSNTKRTDDPITIPHGTFDPLSVLYYVRTVPLYEKAQIVRPVTDGSKTVTGTLRIIKRETLKVPAGKFDTYKVEPSTEGIGGVFQKSKDAKLYIWLTADDRRLPVKVKSKVAVGSFVGELVSIEGPPERSFSALP